MITALLLLAACGDDSAPTSSGGGGSGGAGVPQSASAASTGADSSSVASTVTTGNPASCIPHLLDPGQTEEDCFASGCDEIYSKEGSALRICTSDCNSNSPECHPSAVCFVNANDDGSCFATCAERPCEDGLDCNETLCLIP